MSKTENVPEWVVKLNAASNPECPNSPTGFHQIDTSMEEGPHHCFNCGVNMREVGRPNDPTTRGLR